MRIVGAMPGSYHAGKPRAICQGGLRTMTTTTTRLSRGPAGSPAVLFHSSGDHMNAPMNRRQFFRISAAGMAGSSLAGLGMSPGVALAEVRAFKLARTTETRSTCPYCSVSCGVVMYTLGDKAKNVKSRIIHIEGDA